MARPKGSGTTPIATRFWAKVDKKGPDECWLWTGSCKTPGYGQLGGIMPNGKYGMVDAHRVSYELHNGPIPPGLWVLHRCEDRYTPKDLTVRRCVNPAHLYAGTQKANMKDLAESGRRTKTGHAAGYAHPCRKFTEEDDIIMICLRLAGRGRTEIRERFGIKNTTLVRHLKALGEGPQKLGRPFRTEK